MPLVPLPEELVTLIDEDTPLASMPDTITIIDEEVPLAVIIDEEVPLASMPDTGDYTGNPAPFAIAGTLALAAAYAANRKRRRELEENEI